MKSMPLTISRAMVKRAVKTSAIVGTLLTLINQYNAMLGEVGFHWFGAALTYLVPFVVSLYSGARATKDVTCAFQGEKTSSINKESV